MCSTIKNKKVSAFAMLEYAIVLGVAFAALIGMNTYIKRGLQGRVRDMADYFITDQDSGRQETDITTGGITSETATLAKADIQQEGLAGGGTRLVLADNREIIAHNRVIDEKPPVTTTSFTATGAAKANAAARSRKITDPILRAQADIDALQAEKDGLKEQAEIFQDIAPGMHSEGKAMREQAWGTNWHCGRADDEYACIDSVYSLAFGGEQMEKDGQDMLAQIPRLKAEAEDVGKEISKLTGKLELLEKAERLEKAGLVTEAAKERQKADQLQNEVNEMTEKRLAQKKKDLQAAIPGQEAAVKDVKKTWKDYVGYENTNKVFRKWTEELNGQIESIKEEVDEIDLRLSGKSDPVTQMENIERRLGEIKERLQNLKEGK